MPEFYLLPLRNHKYIRAQNVAYKYSLFGLGPVQIQVYIHRSLLLLVLLCRCEHSHDLCSYSSGLLQNKKMMHQRILSAFRCRCHILDMDLATVNNLFYLNIRTLNKIHIWQEKKSNLQYHALYFIFQLNSKLSLHLKKTYVESSRTVHHLYRCT